MTTSTMTVMEGVSTTQEVKAPFLLSLYSIIPILFAIMLFDGVMFDFQLRDLWLPTDPARLLAWAVIFSFPHVASSLITLADKEYLQFYQKKLINGLVIVAVFVLSINIIAPFLLPYRYVDGLYKLLFLTYAVYSALHLLSQQFGLGMMMMRVPQDKLFQCWRWSSTIFASSIYIMVYGRNVLEEFNAFGFNGYQIAGTGSAVLLCVIVPLGLAQLRNSTNRMGSIYILSNIAMLVSSYVFMALGYSIFAVMVSRFIHDLTAFTIYSVHDHNRNLETARNYIYRALKFIPVTPLFLCFPLALLVGNGLECGAYLLDNFMGFDASINSECIIREYQTSQSSNGLPTSVKLWTQILFIFSLFHFYLEGFVWKRDSIHRHAVKFKV